MAVILFAAAGLSWREAALARRVADAQSRLATLHFNAEDGIAEDESPLNRLAVPVVSLDQEIRQHRARSGYWRRRAENGATDAARHRADSRARAAATSPRAPKQRTRT